MYYNYIATFKIMYALWHKQGGVTRPLPELLDLDQREQNLLDTNDLLLNKCTQKQN